jgi:prephenate dehydratase
MPPLAYLGPEGTFTHQAALDLAREGDEPTAFGSAEEVVRAVEDGRAQSGVVAFENSLQGPIPANLDEILSTENVLLAGERVLPVSFALLRLPDDDSPLRGVVSHPFGLAQCRGFVGGLETREAASTVAACQGLEPGWGALAPRIAGELNGLRVERDAVEDAEHAETRFVLLRHASPPPTGRDRSAFVFRPRQDQPGSLVRLLEQFSIRGVNLTTIKSRPAKVSLGEYVFFIECEGHVADPDVRDAVIGLLRFPGETRFLGSFPEDPSRPPRAERTEGERAREAYEAMLRRCE